MQKNPPFHAYGFFCNSRNTYILWSEPGLNIWVVSLGLEVVYFIYWRWGLWRISLFTKWSSKLQHESALKTCIKSINHFVYNPCAYCFCAFFKDLWSAETQENPIARNSILLGFLMLYFLNCTRAGMAAVLCRVQLTVCGWRRRDISLCT